MYIYNVTVNIEEQVHNEWLDWMQKELIPDMLATGKFTSAKIIKVLVEEEMGGITYSVQYFTKDRETLQRYYIEDAQDLRNKALQKFADKFVAYRTELEIVSEH
ncbi:DUF4286 family protein [Galbibacter pacificus]|uniref:DUF4286 family protein n=1 Tax=Galbibacter pacificus TaxID=2996052 RepID=A0ABT6FT36_9FLAO|nr:DUF4286 family protein [Galbibacter pacificus]MDG3582467.1 DUF4286 family protein [Galbibacter pacificus]MDG3586415.1 DUF4286 family protein [Galbibacter pacificus]